MGFNEFLSSIFGNKSTRDMKEIKPWVEKIKAAYPEIEKLDNDALRAKTEELKKYIHESATAERAKVEELKASIESLELEDREEVFAQIDKTEKEILEKYEKALDEVLPVAFSIVKATAKRFTENEEIVVTATEFDRHLAATKDFVRIEGDKAISRYRELMGATNPANAAEGTIRKKYAESIEANSVHGSDAPETAAYEMAYFFNALEITG